jgi:glycosyltransferase involved in cell wall biosynthesis/uncharacterized membrane protein YbhN (UPF0104 family)
MKILMATPYFESHRGGIEIVAGRLAREWGKLGHKVTWLASNASPPPEMKSVSAVPLATANFIERWLNLPFPLLFPRGFAKIFEEVRKNDATVIHDGLYLTSIAAFLAARRSDKPILLVQHIGVVPYRNPFLRGLMRLANRLLVRPLLSRADRCVFISEATARVFANTPFRDRPEIIFNGVDTNIFVPVDAMLKGERRKQLGLPQQPVILFVGRFVEKKGLHAIQNLSRAHPELTFAFAGWGALNPKAWSLPNVHVFETLANETLAPLYQASDVLVLPSAGEGFPLVVQEALACGLGVVCGTETAEADAAVKPFVTGVNVDPYDAEKTAALFSLAIAKMLQDIGNDGARAARAQFAAKRYSWKNAAINYAQVLAELVNRKQDTALPISSRKGWAVYASTLFSLACGVILIAALMNYAEVNGREILARMSNLNPGGVAALLALWTFYTIVSAEKWLLVERHYNPQSVPSRRAAFALTALGWIGAQVLPLQVATAFMRGIGARILARRVAWQSAAATLYEQAFDLLIVALLGVVSLICVGAGAPQFWPAGAVLLLSGFFMALRALVPLVQAGLRWLGNSSLLQHLARRLPANGPDMLDIRLVRQLVLFSTMRFVLLCAAAAATSHAAELAVPALHLAIAMPLVALASLFPLTPGALGVNELVFASVLAALGTPFETGLQWALLNRLLVISASLFIGCGGVLLLWQETRLVKER